MKRVILLVGFLADSSLWKDSEGDSIKAIRANVLQENAGLLIEDDKMKIFLRNSDGILKAKCLPLQTISQISETKKILKKVFACNVDESKMISMDVDEIPVVMELTEKEISDLKKIMMPVADPIPV